MRIISLVPSLTELICSLNLKQYLVGCTPFCVRPLGLNKHIQNVGGTKNPDIPLIKTLKPSHILVNLEENRECDLNELKKFATLIETFPKSPDEVPTMIDQIAEIFETPQRGHTLADKIRDLLQDHLNLKSQIKVKTCLYFIWNRPWMLASEDTYISKMLSLASYKNIAPLSSRYPTVSKDEIKELNPDQIFFSSEPWPFRKRDVTDLTHDWPDRPNILWIDGRLMSWYGSSSVEGLEQLLFFRQGLANHLTRSFS